MPNQIQQEIFALPVGNKLVATVDGMKLYSNKSLKENYIKAMESVKETKPFVNEISDLVNREKIVPCWMNKGLLKLIAYKVYAPISVKGILGFYHPEHKKLFLLIDNNVFFGFAPNKFLSVLTVHESTHMFAHEQPSKFLSNFEKEMEQWYYHFFVDYFDLDISKKDFVAKEIVDYLFKKVERVSTDRISSRMIKGYQELITKLCKPITTLSEDDFNQRLNNMLTMIRIFSDDPNAFMKVYTRYKSLVNSMYEAYKHAFGFRNLTTLCVQELIYPSEVASIYVEVTKPSKIKTMFKRL